jgi:hypothetical protein
MTEGITAASPSPLRRTGAALAVGAVLGFATSCFIGPSVIGWWYEPPIKDAFSCASSVRASLKQFVTMQVVSALVGGFVVALIWFLLTRSRAKRTVVST